MSHLATRALRVLLVLIALGTVAVQILFIALAVTMTDDTLALIYAVFAAVAIACIQVALVAIWVLLGMVSRDAIFDESAFRWVGVIAVAGLAAAFVVAGLCVHMGEIDDAPGLVLIGGAVVVAGVAFALLMVVMRGLLHQATMLRQELDEVV